MPVPASRSQVKEASTNLTNPSVVLQGEHMLIPVRVYDQLLGVFVAVQKGEYVPAAGVAVQVKEAVARTVKAMNSALVREIARNTAPTNGHVPGLERADPLTGEPIEDDEDEIEELE